MTTTVSALVLAARGASHALKSYAHGNAAPGLAHSAAKALDEAIQGHVDGGTAPYLVWSLHQRQWILTGARGLTPDVRSAGRFARVSAMLICREAPGAFVAVALQDAFDSFGVKVDG